ncbi:VOC family protein [Ampullimonas aquatilis]|uniref:VOC family protein n=1 Tax=Ampullimonas aquatilis TaxID=1341549 RepID=UPI003C79245B
MKFAYTILYVPDVLASLAFYEKAFGFQRGFVHELGTYGELDTGHTTLAFAAHVLGEMHLTEGYVAADLSAKPLGMEVAFMTDDVPAAHQRALSAGASQIKPPTTMPWNQVVSYVRCPDGSLVELCSPVAAG